MPAAVADMGRARLSEKEQVETLNRRATEALQQARRKTIELCMRSHPASIEALWEKLGFLGYDEAMMAKPCDQPQSLQAQAADKKNKVKNELAESVAEEKRNVKVQGLGGEDPNMPEEPVPAKATTLDGLNLTAIRDRILPQAGLGAHSDLAT